MRSADGRYCMVFNGEIYNYVELGDELRRAGVRLQTRSDSEVLLEAYARYGKDVVHRLRGMFAFAVWDCVDRELAPETMASPFRVLPAGHAMSARPDGTVRVYRYWQAALRPEPAPRKRTGADILAALRDSVGTHLRSDAPLGAFLSGGIDSAAICALAAEHKPDLLTFTVGFDQEGYSEIDRAQETAAALGVASLPYVITMHEFFANLPRIVWHLDDPMADAAALPLWFLAREARKHVKVVLSGEGADEIFGGYRVYTERTVVRAGEHLPDWARVPFKRTAALIPPGVKGKSLLERMATRLRHRYIGNAHVFTDLEVDAITRHDGPPAPGDCATATSITEPIFAQARAGGRGGPGRRIR
jgi:asparagine synthase (glutamine-hydrolysing)